MHGHGRLAGEMRVLREARFGGVLGNGNPYSIRDNRQDCQYENDAEQDLDPAPPGQQRSAQLRTARQSRYPMGATRPSGITTPYTNPRCRPAPVGGGLLLRMNDT